MSVYVTLKIYKMAVNLSLKWSNLFGTSIDWPPVYLVQLTSRITTTNQNILSFINVLSMDGQR